MPGAAGVTEPSGINPQGDIVGTYFAVSNNTLITRGFLLSRGAFSNIGVDVPGALAGSTNAIAINALGEIVGFYTDSSFNADGFLLRKGNFTAIEAPASTFTTTTGINLQGDILGFYIDSSGNGHGFLLRRGIFTKIDVPGALAGSTFAKGINLQDDIVGTGSRSPNGINPEGDIVGSYRDSSNNFRSFLLSKGRFTAIDVPAAFGIQTDASGINPQGDIVGTYSDGSGQTHGFLLSRDWRTSRTVTGVNSGTSSEDGRRHLRIRGPRAQASSFRGCRGWAG